MPEWVWEARARTGELRKGSMEADSPEVVESRLRGQQLQPIKVKKKPREIKLDFGSGVRDKDLVIFTRQFATMIDAGVPLVQGLEILSAQGENPKFNAILRDIKGHVEQGGTFSEALKRHPAVFDTLFVNLIAAGEVGGILDTILNRLAEYIEKRNKLKGQVKSALAYPVGILIVALIVIAVMLGFVIPSFKGMFSDMGGEDSMPALTRMVITMSETFIDNFLIIAIVAGAIGAGISYTLKVPKTRRIWHRALLVVPVIGPVMRKIAVSRFTRTLGTLLSSGVPILEAMGIVAKASGNMVVEEAIDATSDRIREGRTMAEPLMETGVFPPMVVQMIGVGEQTGALDSMLNKIADFYEEEVDVAVDSLTSLLEPLMMVFIGGIVGVILIAMYLPIFSIAGNIGH
ncbi:MAG: type II secretion system F family protein [Myxococcales bacterium]|nr:type II secretion system F family protein [Myxococcales bacterium]